MTDFGQNRDGAAAPYPEAAAMAEDAPRRAPAANAVARCVAVTGWLVPYALVALLLRLVMARVFFVAGQGKVEGPDVAITVPGLDWTIATVTLPMAVRGETYQMFERFTALPFPSWLAAPVVSCVEFILPIALVLGLATRFAAIALLIMTVVIQVFVVPQALWSLHIYWMSILLVLISLGPGLISLDHLMRHLYEK